MFLLNGRLVFEKVEFADDWAADEDLSKGISSIIPNPVSLQRFKKEWEYIKSCGEPYTRELLQELAKYKDFDFHLPEDEQVDDCLWLEPYDVEDYQKAAVIEMLNRNRLAVFFDTGTGKTVITIQYLYNKLQNTKNQNVLIVTRSSVVPQYSHAIEKLPEEIKNNNNIIVTSYDLVHKESHQSFNILILDESHSAKNKMTQRHQELRKITKKGVDHIFLMTATPQDKTKLEVITQLSLFSDLILHPKGLTAFKTRYWKLNDYGTPLRQIRSRIHEVNDIISRMSISCIADDVLDIPPMRKPIIIESFKDRDMTEYERMYRHNVIDHNGVRFISNNTSRLRANLREISNGFIYETVVKNPDDPIEEWKTMRVPHRINTHKIDDMRELFLKEKFENSIIFTFFDEDNRMVEELMIELGLNYQSVLRVTKKRRDEIVQGFKDGEFDHLIIKATSGGVGLDLQRTNVIHWYSMPEGWVDLKQGRGRIHRRGQTREQQEYFYFGSKLDKDIYHNVAVKKKKYSDETFSHFLNMAIREKGE